MTTASNMDLLARLRADLDQLQAVDISTMSPAEQLAFQGGLEVVRRRLEHGVDRATGQLDATAAFSLDGHRNVRNAVKHLGRLTGGEALGRTQTLRAMQLLPCIEAAYAAGGSRSPSAADRPAGGQSPGARAPGDGRSAADRWLTGPVFGDPEPYFHPVGQPHEGATEGPEQGLDPDARPTLDEALAARHERQQRVDELLRTATDGDLDRTVRSPNGGDTTVASCLHIVLDEEWWHHRYAARDLAILERRT